MMIMEEVVLPGHAPFNHSPSLTCSATNPGLLCHYRAKPRLP